MQFTKNFKYIILLNFILLISVCLNAQETDSIPPVNTSDTTETEIKKKFKLFNFFKKKEKSGDDDLINEDEEQVSDSAEGGKSKNRFFNFFKKNKNDSIVNDSLNTDSIKNKKRFSLFKKNKNDSANSDDSSKKPQRIFLLKWNKMNYSDQDSLLRDWDDYDEEYYKKKKRFSFTRKEIDIAIKLKKKRNLYERLIYKRARSKPFKYRRKLMNRKNTRYRKTLRFDRLNKSETAPSDTVSDARKYQIVSKRYKREAKREAIKKNKTSIKFDRKEDRLRRRYELSDNETVILNKGKGMRLKGTEKIIFYKARRKQEKFTEKLFKIREKRSFKLQNAKVRKQMRQKNNALKKRDRKQFNILFFGKKKSNKHDSHEYPKRYHK